MYTRAGGFSSLNAVERLQCFLTCGLDGCRFNSDHYGKAALADDGTPKTPADAALEQQNLQHAVQECADVLAATYAFDRKVGIGHTTHCGTYAQLPCVTCLMDGVESGLAF